MLVWIWNGLKHFLMKTSSKSQNLNRTCKLFFQEAQCNSVICLLLKAQYTFNVIANFVNVPLKHIKLILEVRKAKLLVCISGVFSSALAI